jgi:hypothetical protein
VARAGLHGALHFELWPSLVGSANFIVDFLLALINVHMSKTFSLVVFDLIAASDAERRKARQRI